ncbi:MAG: putative hydroxymethylpyrimidine transporter CytX [Actinomycetaceae bacterium]|nr:putative hydroxymethylpyrimidine transporter CytX [Actinomycetaceae bacterium]MDY6082892.1 putative hydroxymethylpyrimidine transporter CytX [Actinomycetaceae bacterium]
MNHRTSVAENGLIWFGAGLSVAEILTGTAFAPLGFSRAFTAILLGHVIGCSMLFAAGLIGALTRRSAMQTVQAAFGYHGGKLFAALNVVQLAGWTSIMIYDAGSAAHGVFHAPAWVWDLVVGGLIIVWILIGLTNLGRINWCAMTALFVMTLVISVKIVGSGSSAGASGDAMSFSAAVELSAAMPLSWLPLISDYTRVAARPRAASAASAIVYGVVSCWMYMIGFAMANFTGTSDIAEMLVRTGLGALGLLVIIFSTVTTTFLDAYSSGVSAQALHRRINGKYIAILVTLLGTLAAMLFNMDSITDFLYWIGSVFAPMIAVLIVDYCVMHRDSIDEAFDVVNLLTWGAGFVLYRCVMRLDLPLGYTVWDVVATGIICVVARWLVSRVHDARAASHRE